MKHEHACSTVFDAWSLVVETEVKGCHNRKRSGKTGNTASCEKAFKCQESHDERFLPLCHTLRFRQVLPMYSRFWQLKNEKDRENESENARFRDNFKNSGK